ncbi:transposase, partial [Escherichia coli]|uniref:transposase n=1 Tax=Escherichia coli TaxID=562 RepID=UPI0021B3A806
MIWQPEFTDKTLSRKPGAVQSISKLALENGINANLLFKWRQQWREGKLLLPSSESP